VKASSKTMMAAKFGGFCDSESAMVRSFVQRVYLAHRLVHYFVGSLHEDHSSDSNCYARASVGMEVVEEDCQLLDVGLLLASDLLNTTHEIVMFDGVRAKRHARCRLETVEVLLVVDDVLCFMTLEVLRCVLKDLNPVVLEKSFLRNVVERFIESNIHDDECLPHVECPLMNIVGEMVNMRP
jgi:hypothetical protein